MSHQVYGLVQENNKIYAATYDEFTQAIALDPSDSLSYADMASALVLNGRPVEAIPYLTTAMRLDPHYPPQYLYFLGLAQFGMNQFEAAATSFAGETRRNSSYADPFLYLGATYGYLNRKQDAVSAIASFNKLIGREGHGPITLAGDRRLS